MKFKTNARCSGCKAAIFDAVGKEFPDAQLSMDLEDADKVLEVQGVPENQENAWKVLNIIQATGFKGSWIQPASEY